MDELEHIIRGWIIRYRLQRGTQWSSLGLIFGLSLGLGLALVALIQNKLLLVEYLDLAFGVGAGVTIIAFLAGLFWGFNHKIAAQALDRILGLQERISTALEINNENSSQNIPQEIIQRQLKDTLDHIKLVNPRRILRLEIKRTQIFISIVLSLTIVLIGLRGEKFFQAAQFQRVVQQAIHQEIEQIEILRAEIKSDPRLTSEQQQELAELLDQTQGDLVDAQTAEQAVSALISAQEKLMALTDSYEQGQVLQNLGNSLMEPVGNPLQEVGEQLAAGDYLQASQALENIDAYGLSNQEQLNLSQQLLESVDMLESIKPELADQIRQAADALQVGNAQAANQALQESAQILREIGQQIIQSEVANHASSQIGQGKTQIQSAGLSASEQASRNGQETQSGASGSSQAQSPDHQSGSGSGSGHGEGENTTSDSEAGSQPIDQVNRPGNSDEKSYEQIFAPTRLGGQSDAQLILPESEDIGEQLVGMNDTNPGESGFSNVPYVDVYTYYLEFYRQAITSGEIPTALREFVRQYFMSLEP